MATQDEAAAVSLAAVSEAVGRLEEVHFVLFGRDILEEYHIAAMGIFGEPLSEEQENGTQAEDGKKPTDAPNAETLNAGAPNAGTDMGA